MIDGLSRVSTALAGRYEVEKELGRGGMATVYRAKDLRHGRMVAIKVMSADVATTVGAERFLREIEIAAGLTHPNILPLIDSGKLDDGQAYYIMPFIDGESLRQKLARDGQLSIDDAVRLAREVADALQHAHDHGVIHRDIKPENILLSGGHAVVADFGVARALTQPGGTLTQTGSAIGTPLYMSPEQAAADPSVDARSDVYSLGVVLYEMLCGSAPHQGQTAQAILARKMIGPPPSLRAVRPAIPVALEQAVLKSMEVAAADRFATARDFGAALARATTGEGASSRPAGATAMRLRFSVAVVVVLAVIAGWKFFKRPTSTVDDRVVAVLPFRVSGADTSAARYRLGMPELLHASFTGEGGLRSVSPASVLSVWRGKVKSPSEDLPDDEAMVLARRVGAGRLLTGSIVGVPNRLVIDATLTPLDGGEPINARAEGHPDSVLALVDKIVAELLVRSSIGVARPQLGALTTTSLPALKAYLDGQNAYRRSDYKEAAVHYNAAIKLDSGFALAGVGLVKTAGWGISGASFDDGMRVAWRSKDRLGPRDRAQFDVYAAGDYPGPTYPRDAMPAAEKLIKVAPDDPEAWHEYADGLFHYGSQLDIPDAFAQARRGFERSVALDSGFAAPVGHLIDLAGATGDTAGVRKYYELRRRQVAQGGAPMTFPHVWRYAVTFNDKRLLDSLHAAVQAGKSPSTALTFAESEAIDLEMPVMALEKRWRDGSGDHVVTGIVLVQLYENLGQPAQAERILAEMARGPTWRLSQTLRVTEAIYSQLDTIAGAKAAAELARYADTVKAVDLGTQRDRWMSQAVIQLWRVNHGDYSGLERTAAMGKPLLGSPKSAGYEREAALMVGILEAIAEKQRKGERMALQRLDSALSRGMNVPGLVESLAVLTAARLWEDQGDPVAALRALRRTAYDFANSNKNRAIISREEGRLAALTGDRRAAINAYERLLRFRENAEPSLVPERERVRAELRRLTDSR